MKVCIVIPAHNEENRIGLTLDHYCTYFNKLREQGHLQFELLVVLNGCIDNTLDVVRKAAERCQYIEAMALPQAGKGLAVAAGFKNALTRDFDLIGFVDADMATAPSAFYQLIKQIGDADGIIASRYMRGSKVYPPRPLIKRLGSMLIYESLIFILFGMRYHDFQCGAKLFKREVIATIAPELRVTQWGFDVELLYLCKRHHFNIKEVSTIWYDQSDSKLKLFRSGLRMIGSLFLLRLRYSPFKSWVS